MIKVYPVKIEAVDDEGELTFIMQAIDAHAATIELKTVIRPDNIEQLVDAMRKAVQMLELE